MDKLQKIAEGATAEIFAWEHNRILKLFFDSMPSGMAQLEADRTSAVIASGFPAPTVYEVITLAGRTGIVYDRIDGKSFLQILEAQIWRGFALMRMLAETHAQLHSHQADASLPALRPSLASKISSALHLSDATKSKLLKHLDTLPDGNTVCHCDFHVQNVLYNGQKPVVIDWIDAKSGNPHADVARTLVIHSERPTIAEVGRLLAVLLPVILKPMVGVYFRTYCRLTNSNKADIQQWIPIMAAARLRESSAKHDQLIAMIQQWEKSTP